MYDRGQSYGGSQRYPYGGAPIYSGREAGVSDYENEMRYPGYDSAPSGLSSSDYDGGPGYDGGRQGYDGGRQGYDGGPGHDGGRQGYGDDGGYGEDRTGDYGDGQGSAADYGVSGQRCCLG